MKKLLAVVCLSALVSTTAFAGGVTVDLGVGGAIPISPDAFSDGFDPSVAFNLDISGPLRGVVGAQNQPIGDAKPPIHLAILFYSLF